MHICAGGVVTPSGSDGRAEPTAGRRLVGKWATILGPTKWESKIEDRLADPFLQDTLGFCKLALDLSGRQLTERRVRKRVSTEEDSGGAHFTDLRPREHTARKRFSGKLHLL